MREKTWNELTADSTEHGKDIYALESTVESGSGAGQFPGLSSLCLPHLLPRLGGVAGMSWAPMGIMLDPFNFLLTHKVKNYYNDGNADRYNSMCLASLF